MRRYKYATTFASSVSYDTWPKYEPLTLATRPSILSRASCVIGNETRPLSCSNSYIRQTSLEVSCRNIFFSLVIISKRLNNLSVLAQLLLYDLLDGTWFLKKSEQHGNSIIAPRGEIRLWVIAHHTLTKTVLKQDGNQFQLGSS